jgi:galactokinase
MGQAFLETNGQALPVLDLAEEMARAERYTGTKGGGMDQAISLGALEGHASRIEFDPLRIFECPVPPDWRFVVAHTLVRAEKSGPAQEAYNLRTRECREALHTIGRVLADGDGGKKGPGGSPRGPGDPGEADARVPRRADLDHLTYPELLQWAPLPEILELAETHLEGDPLKRFRHVVTEAARVYEAEEAMRRADLLTFGILMDASHESLREDYEVSSPELDQLVSLARGAGAAGARLTGAGFGGCMVALTDPRRLPTVMDTLAEEYYGSRAVPDDSLESVLFVARPSAGASVVKL